MWEVLSFGDKPYGEMSNQEVNLDYFPISSLIQLLSLLILPPRPWSFPMSVSFQFQPLAVSCAAFCYFFAILVNVAYR